jgi:hypothetical protein
LFSIHWVENSVGLVLNLSSGREIDRGVNSQPARTAVRIGRSGAKGLGAISWFRSLCWERRMPLFDAAPRTDRTERASRPCGQNLGNLRILGYRNRTMTEAT